MAIISIAMQLLSAASAKGQKLTIHETSLVNGTISAFLMIVVTIIGSVVWVFN